MKTFEEALKDEIIRKTSIMESEGWDISIDPQVLIVFESGANWASTSPELINEILTKYHEWAHNLPAQQFSKWDDEEGDHEKTKARIRKEFIEFLKREQ
jgi:hypothetical protein